MKLKQSLFIFASAAFLLAITGCTGPGYDPSVRSSTSPNDKVQVTSIAVSPTKPVAMKPWKVSMSIKNVSSQSLDNVRYEFLLNGREDNKLGTGTIPHIGAGESVEVSSEPGTKLEQSSYRVEGRVFLDKNEETAYADRMNNWMSVQFYVAQ